MTIPIYVDFNSREIYPDGNQSVFVKMGLINPDKMEEKFFEGSPVLVYDEEISVRGILRRCKEEEIWGNLRWLVDLIPGTTVEHSNEKFIELLAETKRSAMRIVD